MNELQVKLNFLLEKYSVKQTAVLIDDKTVEINGKAVPLFAHRSERRLIELKNIVQGGTLVGVSVMRVASIVPKSHDIYAELYRELDICEFILEQKLVSIMVMQNDNVMTAISTTESGVVCTLEISATLGEDEPCKDKHEIISQRGIACDIAVDVQLKQDSIYFFGNENSKYTDVDFELYGLSPENVAVVRDAFTVAQTNCVEARLFQSKRLEAMINAAIKSAANGTKEVF